MRESVELAIRSVHLIASIIWFGGVVFFAVILVPILRHTLPPQHLLALHNRFRGFARLTIHVLLTTGAMVFFIFAWNTGFFAESRGSDFNAYMLTFIAKLAAFGMMALCWGIYSSLYRRHLEATGETYHSPSVAVSVWRGLMLIAGGVVFALSVWMPSQP